MKQKLAYYKLELTSKIWFSEYIITFHGILSQLVVSLLSRIDFSKQNVHLNELNIVLLYEFCSNEFK